MKQHRNNPIIHILQLFVILFSVLLFTLSWAQDEQTQSVTPDLSPLKPPTNIEVKDTPNDDGGSITVRWSEPVAPEGVIIGGYRVQRALSVDGQPGQFSQVGESLPGRRNFRMEELKIRKNIFIE